MSSDPLYIEISRSNAVRIVEFLTQYKEHLEHTQYAQDEYKADVVEDCIICLQKSLVM